MATAIPPAAVRTAPQTVPPADVPAATPPAATPPAANAPSARDVHDAQMRAQAAGGVLTSACFIGAGLAIAFCPVAAPIFMVIGAIIGLDWMGDMLGFSPVKALTGKSIGGWVAGGFSNPTPREPEQQPGVNLRARQPTPRRQPAEADDREREDRALPPSVEPEPIPVS